MAIKNDTCKGITLFIIMPKRVGKCQPSSLRPFHDFSLTFCCNFKLPWLFLDPLLNSMTFPEIPEFFIIPDFPWPWQPYYRTFPWPWQPYCRWMYLKNSIFELCKRRSSVPAHHDRLHFIMFLNLRVSFVKRQNEIMLTTRGIDEETNAFLTNINLQEFVKLSLSRNLAGKKEK